MTVTENEPIIVFTGDADDGDTRPSTVTSGEPHSAHGITGTATACGNVLVDCGGGSGHFLVSPGDWDEWVEHDPEWRSESGLRLWDSWSQRGEDVEWDEEFECWRIR